MNKYCMCIMNQKKSESIGFMPNSKSMLKSAGIDLDSAELGLRKAKRVALPVVSIGITAYVVNKAYQLYKVAKHGSNNASSGNLIEVNLYTPGKIYGPLYFNNVETFKSWLKWKGHGVTFDNEIERAWNTAHDSSTRNRTHVKRSKNISISFVRPSYVKQKKYDFDGFAYVDEVSPRVYNNLKPGEYLDYEHGILRA